MRVEDEDVARSVAEEEETSVLFFCGGNRIVKSGTPVDRDVVGIADWVEIVPPGVRSPEGVTSPGLELEEGSERLKADCGCNCPLARFGCCAPLPVVLDV